jgi:maleate cis-trans isomerase
MSFDFPAPNRGTARIGVLVPFTNINLEPDLAMLAPEGVSLHVARIGGYDAREVPDEAQMTGLGEAPIEEPLAMIAGARPDVVIYGSTAASFTHGAEFDRTLAEQVEAATGAPVVTAAGAVVRALARLGVRRVGVASPYVSALNDLAERYLTEAGVETAGRADIGAALGNHQQGALTPAEVVAMARRADAPEAEAVVLVGTDLRAVEAIEVAEAELGKPVIASNQALMLAALEAIGMGPEAVRCGRLFAGVPAA